jgi:hypothetical protein
MYSKKIRAFLTSPSQAFAAEQKSSLGEAFKYMAVSAIIVSAMSGLIAFFGGPLAVIVILVSVYFGQLIGGTVWGLIFHVFAYLLGARQGLHQTLKAVYYAGTPHYILGWIPFVNIVTAVWTIVLQIIGLKTLQKMSTGMAVLAFVIPLIIVVVISVVLFAALLLTLIGSGAIDPTMYAFVE